MIFQAEEKWHPCRAQWRWYVDCSARILAIVDNNPNEDHILYLSGWAHMFYVWRNAMLFSIFF